MNLNENDLLKRIKELEVERDKFKYQLYSANDFYIKLTNELQNKVEELEAKVVHSPFDRVIKDPFKLFKTPDESL
jgi:hypothetical protein